MDWSLPGHQASPCVCDHRDQGGKATPLLSLAGSCCLGGGRLLGLQAGASGCALPHPCSQVAFPRSRAWPTVPGFLEEPWCRGGPAGAGGGDQVGGHIGNQRKSLLSCLAGVGWGRGRAEQQSQPGKPALEATPLCSDFSRSLLPKCHRGPQGWGLTLGPWGGDLGVG